MSVKGILEADEATRPAIPSEEKTWLAWNYPPRMLGHTRHYLVSYADIAAAMGHDRLAADVRLTIARLGSPNNSYCEKDAYDAQIMNIAIKQLGLSEKMKVIKCGGGDSRIVSIDHANPFRSDEG